MDRRVNRREFLLTSTAAAVTVTSTAGAAPAIPRRTLGRTGAEVSILGFGGGSRFLMYEDEDTALRILNECVDSGINYLDTAISYGNGKSETRYGRFLKTRRNDVWVATKVSDRGYDEAMRAIEASLQRLQTDHVDLLHIHSLENMDDLARIEAPQGVLKALYRAREEKMARFIGMTCHAEAAALKAAIERHDLDCVQMALNAATDSGHATGFERIALPAAKARNLGILAMKIAGQEQLVGTGSGKASMADLLRYSMSLPVASCVVGMPRPEHLRENIEIARTFKPLTDGEKERIREQVRPAVVAFDHFLRHHRDCGLA